MGKGVLADNRLIELHSKTRHGCHTARDVHDFSGIDLGGERHNISTHFQGHHNLFQCGIARTFAQTVDRAFHLTGATLNSGQTIGRGHAKIIVTMGRENNIISPRHRRNQVADQISAFHWGRIPHRIRNIDRACASLNRNLNHTAQIVPFRPGGIHRRPLHVVA